MGSDEAYPISDRVSSRVAETARLRGGWLGPRQGSRKGRRPGAPTKFEARVATSTAAIGHDAVRTSGRSDITMVDPSYELAALRADVRTSQFSSTIPGAHTTAASTRSAFVTAGITTRSATRHVTARHARREL